MLSNFHNPRNYETKPQFLPTIFSTLRSQNLEIFRNLRRAPPGKAVLGWKSTGLQGYFPINDPSEVAIFTWKMPTKLNRMKNQYSDFCDIYFLSYGWFCLQFSSVTLIFKYVADQKWPKKLCCRSEVATFSWKMRNVLKRMKNIIPIFSFWDMVVQNLTSWLKKKFISKDAQCSETDILVQEFFFVMFFSFWDMVDFFLSTFAVYWSERWLKMIKMRA